MKRILSREVAALIGLMEWLNVVSGSFLQRRIMVGVAVF